MTFLETAIPGVVIIEPQVWKDDRGYFFESFSDAKFKEAGIDTNFVQDNQSLSQRGTLRGLHGQAGPYAQGKLVRVVSGKVIDIAVDIRKDSETFGEYVSVELSADNFRMLWIPAGFLHGFVTLEDNTIFTYKVTNPYNKASEIGVIWNDPTLDIDWQVEEREILLSEKDLLLPSLAEFDSPF